jgi:mRNA interferase RelE/StbE
VVYRIEFKPAALRDLRKLPEEAIRRITAAIDALALGPRPSGVKKLKGKGRHVFYRLRVGDHRVIYQVHDDTVLVLVVRIADRKEIYRLEL